MKSASNRDRLTNWCDLKEEHFFPPSSRKTFTVRLANHSTTSLQTTATSNTRPCSQFPLRPGAGMQLFRHRRRVFGSLFYFNRGEIGNIFFYSPLAPLESLLSFGLFMKNYFMLTYICCLFSPSVTCSRFSFISWGLNADSLCVQVSLLNWVEIEIPVCSGKGAARGNPMIFYCVGR